MKVFKNESLKLEYKKIRHASGLTLLLCPMPEFASSYALFATKYGSVDSVFKFGPDDEFAKVPDGIAHYLEHKLFENEEGDAFIKYAETGASANAYTSFDRTAYLFSATDKFRESLEILLDFVTRPYFTKESVDKEREIIGQEIQMYVDDPDWRVFFNLLTALYKNHPVNIDIAGTRESIAQIDPELLYKCYGAFYNLHNMVLSIAGNFSEAQVLECCDRYLKPAPDFTVERAKTEEPAEVACNRVVINLEVSNNLFHLGYKIPPVEEKAQFLKQAYYEVLTESIAGEFTACYRELYDGGLINSEFGSEVFSGAGYCSLIFSGESSDPDKVEERITREIERLKAEGIPENIYAAAHRSVYGRYVQALGRIAATASMMMSCEFAGVGTYDIIDELGAMTKQKLEEILRSDVNTSHRAISIVAPNLREKGE